MFENRITALNYFNEDSNAMKKEYSSPVITIEPESSIHDALVQMQTNFIKRVVIAAKNKPLGIVSERDISKYLENDKTAKALDEIPIKYVMKKQPIVLPDGLDDQLSQSASRMETFKIGSVILVDDEGKLIGILTKTDITKAFSVIHGGQYRVKDYMSKRLITCRKTDSLRFALNMMNQNNISRIIVTDNEGNPVGLITTNTFLTHSDYFSTGNTRSRDYLLPLKSRKLNVEDLISKDLLKIVESEDLSKAASLMIKNKISGLPVVNNEQKLVGVIDNSDIVRAFNDVRPHEKLAEKYGYLH